MLSILLLFFIFVIVTAIAVPLVVSKASSERMATILKKVGADKIIDPEKEGGVRSARILASQAIHDYYELDDNLCMVELQPRNAWLGKSLIELDLRKKHNMNVAAIKEKGGNWRYINPSHKLTENNLLMVILEKKDIEKWK